MNEKCISEKDVHDRSVLTEKDIERNKVLENVNKIGRCQRKQGFLKSYVNSTHKNIRKDKTDKKSSGITIRIDREHTKVKKDKNDHPTKDPALIKLDKALERGMINKDVYQKARDRIHHKTAPKKEQKKSPNISHTAARPHTIRQSISLDAVKNVKFSEDINTLNTLYRKNRLKKEEFERCKDEVESGLTKIEKIAGKTLEKEDMGILKEKIENEISKSENMIFSHGNVKNHDAQMKVLNDFYKEGLITKERYIEKKEELEERNKHFNHMLYRIDFVLEDYMQSLEHKINRSKEKTVTPQTVKEEISAEETKKSFLSTIINRSGNKPTTAEQQYLAEIKNINDKELGRDAVTGFLFIVKKCVINKFNIEDQPTYDELAFRLKNAAHINNALRIELADFFSRISCSEYAGLLDEKDTAAVYIQSLKLIKKVENLHIRTKGKKNKEENVEDPNDDTQETRPSILEKINKTLGI